MDWFFQVIFFGLLAGFLFILSACFTVAKKHIIGLLFGVLELLSAAVSSGAWAYALKISGKSDWFLFGIGGYTPIGLICFAMFAVGIGCVVLNLRGIVRRPAKPAAQD